MKIDILPVAPLGANCVLLSDDSKDLIIVDPGGEIDKITQYIEAGQLIPRMILLTHGHFDHISAAHDLHIKYKAPVSIHKADENLLTRGPDSARYFGLPPFSVPKADSYLEDGQEIAFGDAVIKVLHTPGHSAGSVSFYIPAKNMVLTGDTLFNEGIGRTDFQGSNPHAILDSIRLKLYSLNDNTVVYPGHGPATNIGHEKEYNPYVNGSVNGE